ncbi:uncharacterized protein B0I36DRAFT_119123 [Microdochium trichocladiopsis]|uniref:Uncharacterized protein n=1 Tax=Microdochium trichocladiopsis TaxID=1682393 RepID=A0A9P8Y6D0_9PEZI|nr:uncharacterized protein B0I36DRAFT_119123 [Microdochium trichocladiopsis]KAH7031151.1 hypothetical protein B0I36DRAFT_119123 [Microdochium trichocladiopsis]
MALRYTEEELVFLRQSPLCVKPNALPPAEEWMGAPPEAPRNNTQSGRTDGNRNRHDDGSMLDQGNRRAGADRHLSRNSTNPEDIGLGLPRPAFSTSTFSRTSATDKSLTKDSDGRFPFRSRAGETESADRNRGARVRERDGRTEFRRRGDADQDSDGWSTVKPRKSFGTEGAERFHGRLGERSDRLVGDRRPREQDEREGDKTRRNFGEFGKDKDAEDSSRRNGLGRTRADQNWTRGEAGNQSDSAPAPARERFDRAKSWRERATADEQPNDTYTDKPRERGHDRRWDRDQRQEREPEWLDEPAEDKAQAHTQEDFQKFMESMKAARSGAKPEPDSSAPKGEPASRSGPHDRDTAPRESLPVLETGPDQFFAAYGQGSALEALTPEASKENMAPSKHKASRFQNFFSTQEETRRQVEATPPPAPRQAPPPGFNPLLELLSAGPAPTAPRPASQDFGSPPQNDVAEKVAFQALLTKLQKQSFSSPPPNGGFPEPPPSHELGLPKGALGPPAAFSPYGQERRDVPMHRGPPQNPELHAPRPQQHAHMAAGRPEQMLHELLGQRQNSHSQGLPRNEQPSSRNSNSNTEFLMTLMQGSARAGMDHPQHNQPPMRMPQPSRAAQIPQTPDREPDYQRERSASQHQGGRPGGLPAFFDEPHLQHREPESRGPQQPTQILQRQGPPGLDQMHPSAWMQQGGAGQQMPPPGRPMIPPPGLGSNARNGPPVPGMFPPNFPMGAFPPPEGMPPGPPRNMAPPPGFFGGPPPPGFMGPPPGMGGFQGPEGLGFGFDGRGMPPPTANGPFRRN